MAKDGIPGKPAPQILRLGLVLFLDEPKQIIPQFFYRQSPLMESSPNPTQILPYGHFENLANGKPYRTLQTATIFQCNPCGFLNDQILMLRSENFLYAAKQ